MHRCSVFALVLVALSAWAAAPRAHPHVWIDAVTRVHLDDARRVRAVELVWAFDILYSEATRAELDGNGNHRTDPEELRTFARDIAEALLDWHYFMDVRSNGRPVETGTAEHYAAYVVDGRIAFRVTVPLAEPAAVGTALEVRQYDPTFYIAIDLLPEDGVRFHPAKQEACSAEVVLPEDPGDEFRSLLAQDNFDQAPEPDVGGGIGIIFAQVAKVVCR